MSYANVKGRGRKMISAEQANGFVLLLLAEEEWESLYATMLLGTWGSTGLSSPLGCCWLPVLLGSTFSTKVVKKCMCGYFYNKASTVCLPVPHACSEMDASLVPASWLHLAPLSLLFCLLSVIIAYRVVLIPAASEIRLSVLSQAQLMLG